MDHYLIWIILFVCGALAFALSSITAGGGALMLIPVLNFLIGAGATAPVLNTGNLIGRPVRVILYWQDINWKAVLYYVPFAILGSLLAGYLFSQIRIPLLQLLVGLFLVSTLFQYRWGKKEHSFSMSYPLLAPLGVIIAFIGTLTGASGPILNPFYLNLGISKESLIGTKAFNSFFMGLSQVGSYTFFGLMGSKEWGFAIALGLGITLGNFYGKKLLAKMTHQSFRQWAIAFMVISGVLLIIQAVVELNSQNGLN